MWSGSSFFRRSVGFGFYASFYAVVAVVRRRESARGTLREGKQASELPAKNDTTGP